MYRQIMVPVDLAHVERLEKALATAGDLARHYDIPVAYVGVTESAPSERAHNPAEFEAKLTAFAAAEADKRGITATAHAYLSHDPAVDLDGILLRAVGETDADLVIMASHVPGLAEYVFASNAGYVASHSAVSVFVVR